MYKYRRHRQIVQTTAEPYRRRIVQGVTPNRPAAETSIIRVKYSLERR